MKERDLDRVLRELTPLVPKDEIENRTTRFQEAMRKKGIEKALLFHPPDIYYFAGSTQEGCFYLPAQGQPLYLVQKYAPRARVESPWEVVPLRSFKELPSYITLEGTVGTELDLITLTRYQRLQKLFPKAQWKDISPLIREKKGIKSPWEVETLRKAGEILVRGYIKARKLLQEGLTEMELAARIFLEMRLLGHEDGETMRSGRMEGFMGHLLSGYTGAFPSYMNAPLNGVGLSPANPTGPSLKKIGRREPIVMDFFATHMGYLTDMTRTLCIGQAPSKMREAHKVLEEMHKFLKNNLKPGTNTLDIFNGVLEIAQESPFRDYFMGYGDYRVNFIGHGVGTEIDEYPFIARGLEMELKENMVVAVEPKFLFPGEGAVGLENTYLVTFRGGEVLTPAPEELWEKHR